MPTYSFQCTPCEISFDQSLSFNEFDKLGKKKRVKCPKCKHKKGVTQVFEDILYAKVDNVTTVGQLAERNSKKIGKVRLEEAQAKEIEKQPKLPAKHWYGKMDSKKQREIFGDNNLKTQREKINKYIETGK